MAEGRTVLGSSWIGIEDAEFRIYKPFGVSKAKPRMVASVTERKVQ